MIDRIKIIERMDIDNFRPESLLKDQFIEHIHSGKLQFHKLSECREVYKIESNNSHYVVKLKPTLKESYLRKKCVQLMRESGMTVADIYYEEDGLSISEYIDGVPLLNYKHGHIEIGDKIKDIAEYLAKLHKIPLGSLQKYVPTLRGVELRIDYVLDKLISEAIISVNESISLKNKLISKIHEYEYMETIGITYGELISPSNIMVDSYTGKFICMIDYDAVRVDSIMRDIKQVDKYMTENLFESFIEHYAFNTRISKEKILNLLKIERVLEINNLQVFLEKNTPREISLKEMNNILNIVGNI